MGRSNLTVYFLLDKSSLLYLTYFLLNIPALLSHKDIQ